MTKQEQKLEQMEIRNRNIVKEKISGTDTAIEF